MRRLSAIMGLLSLLLLASSVRAMPIPAGVSNVCAGGQWTEAQAMTIAHRPSFTSASMRYRYQGFPLCGRRGSDMGSSAVYLNLSDYDRRFAAGGDLVQLGIWWRDTDSHPSFVYTADNNGGGLGSFPAPYPRVGHEYTLSIRLAADRWHLQIIDNTVGHLIHERDETAHWHRARSAWMMFETYDDANQFAPGRITSFAVDGQRSRPRSCSVRGVVSTEPGRYTLTPSTGSCSVTSKGFSATR